MTRRERLERRAEKRREWAESRSQKAAESWSAARAATAGIEFGQPILVGHHSERRHRGALKRQDAAMRKASEHSDMAAAHAGGR